MHCNGRGGPPDQRQNSARHRLDQGAATPTRSSGCAAACPGGGVQDHLQRDLPGLGATPLGQKQIDDRAARESIPAAKAKLEQIGALAVFLCSDAAAQIRGAALSIDGGWTAQ